MKKYLLFPFLLFSLCTCDLLPANLQQPLPSEERVIPPPGYVKIAIDIADTPEKSAWGLMGISFLPTHQGMLFPYDPPRMASIWMFNVYIDLSVAFIDSNNTIREIHKAQAFPDLLLPRHRIANVQGLSLLSVDDPVVDFFIKHSVHSGIVAHYALEMNQGWFLSNNIQAGDRFDWQRGQKEARVHRSLNLAKFQPAADQSLTLMLTEASPLALWLPTGQSALRITLFDGEKHEIATAVLKEASGYYSSKLVKYVLISHPGL